MIVLIAVLFFLSTPDNSPLLGRLATVEPAARRLTLIPDGEVNLIELFMAEDGEVIQNERRLSLSDLVIQVGRKVTVHYRIDRNRRVATRVTVEAEQSSPLRELARPATHPQ